MTSDAGAMSDVPALAVHDVSKSFGAVHAVREVSMELYYGQVVGLLGDNGAGKSTLIKCIAGLYRPDSGAIHVDGRAVVVDTPQTARDLGIEAVHQGLALVDKLDVAANLFLNRELRASSQLWRFVGWLDKASMYREAERILGELRVDVPSVRVPVEKLSGGQRQAVAIGRAVAWGRHIVLMDEPTAALGVEQASHVNSLIRTLGAQGVAIILISHNMQHVLKVCDRAVVLRHGRKVGDVAVPDISERDLVDLITGASTRH